MLVLHCRYTEKKQVLGCLPVTGELISTVYHRVQHITMCIMSRCDIQYVTMFSGPTPRPTENHNVHFITM